jgi:L-amino acid N-acyltransferase YncA
MLPKKVLLRDGREAELNLLSALDREGLIDFYANLPEQERQVLRDDVTTKAWADRFLDQVARGEIVCLVAKESNKVVGEGSLYRSFQGWTRFVGEIRLTTARTHRRQGLGLAMGSALVKLATDLGLEKLIVNRMECQQGTRCTFEKLGFRQEAILRGHVKDLSGTKRDLVVMSNNLMQGWIEMEFLVLDHSFYVCG